ncbi:MAG: alkene reductase [Edaphobacter sp.]|nr:alkene reductase [Edaphobacter sp.]
MNIANWPAPQPLCLLLLTQLLSSALEVDAQRVGVKISPMHECCAFQANDETLPVTEYAIRKLSTYNLHTCCSWAIAPTSLVLHSRNWPGMACFTISVL